QLALFPFVGHCRGLPGKDRLQGRKRHAENNEQAQERDEGGILLCPHFAGDRMNQGHKKAADKCGYHHPTALPEEGGLALHTHFYDDNERKNLSRTWVARSRDAVETHSSAVCAWAMSPGPKTTLAMPDSARMAASQK